MIDPLLCSQIITLFALIGFESQECALKLQEWHSLNIFPGFAYRVIHAEQSLLFKRFRGISSLFLWSHWCRWAIDQSPRFC